MKTTLMMAAAILLMTSTAPAITPSYEVVVPAAVRGAGGGGSVWQLDLYLSNLGDATASVSVHWLERNTNNTVALPADLTIEAGKTVVLDDALMSLFSLPSAAGAVRSGLHPTARRQFLHLQSQRRCPIRAGIRGHSGFSRRQCADRGRHPRPPRRRGEPIESLRRRGPGGRHGQGRHSAARRGCRRSGDRRPGALFGLVSEHRRSGQRGARQRGRIDHRDLGIGLVCRIEGRQQLRRSVHRRRRHRVVG